MRKNTLVTHLKFYNQLKSKLSIKSHSGVNTLLVEQHLPITLEEAWNFFSNPRNLVKITPKKMGFQITSENTSQAYSGQIISYKVGIFPLIKSNWVTEITSVKPLEYFIDEQRFGPYAMWHHEHHFKKVDTGVIMIDKVTYKLPFGILGRLSNFFIKKQLKEIFEFRSLTLQEVLQD